MRKGLATAIGVAAVCAVCTAGASAATTTEFRDYANRKADVRATAVTADEGTVRITKFSAWVTMGCGWRADRGFEKFGGVTKSIENDGDSFKGEIRYGPNSDGLVSGSVVFSGHRTKIGKKPALVGTVSMTATGTSDDDEGAEQSTCNWGPIDFTAVPPDKVPPRITSVSLKPNPFHPVAAGIEAPKPSQGGVTIRYRLSEPIGYTMINFKRTDQSGCKPTAPTICSDELFATGNAGKNKRYWNGRLRDGDSAKPLRSGTYRVVFVAIDYAGNKTTLTRTVSVSAAP